MTHPSHENGFVGENASEWLPGGVAAPPQAPEEIARPLRPRSTPPARPEPTRRPEPREDGDAAGEVERLRVALRRAERRAEFAEERVQRLEERLRHLDASVAASRPAAEVSAARLAAAKAAEAPAADAGPARDEGGPLDVNRATFEALRALGLSVSQSARFIGQREEHGGFRSLADLDGLYGLPRDVIETLKRHGSV